MSVLLGRYVLPLSQLPRTRRNLTRLAEALVSATPLTLTIDVDELSFAEFARIVDPARPLWLTLRGEHPELPPMIAHATQGGARVTLETDGCVNAGRAYALIGAGLAELLVDVHHGDPERYPSLERVFRSVERLVAMRDANRKPGPAVALRLTLTRDNASELHTLMDLCHQRFQAVQPRVALADTVPFGDDTVRAALQRARKQALRQGALYTLASIDAARDRLTQG